MDYEKAYNEAQERFKAFKEKYYTRDTYIGDVIFDKTGNMQKDFESIFPEKESKDKKKYDDALQRAKKIREELIEFIQWSEDRGMTRHDFHQAKRPSEWIAWLEHQNYLYERVYEETKDRFYQEGVEEGIAYEKHKEQKDLFKDGIGHYFYDGDKVHFCSAPAMEVRESDDSDEPVEHRHHIREVDLEKDKAIEILEDYLKWAVSMDGECLYTWNELADAIRLGISAMKEQKTNIELIQKSWYMEGYHDRNYNKEPKWIIKTGEGGPRYEENPKYGKLIEEKPTEYLDKDDMYAEKMGFHKCKTGEVVTEWKKEDIDDKMLSKPKQEWSEEDEEIRDNIICILQKDVTYTPPTRPNSCTGSGNAFYTHQTEIDWLKSLRPSWKPREVCYGQKGDPDPAGVWKPSEEQMKALWDAYKGGKEQEPLRELIEQLKKL